jgi:hypothetical protein
MNRSMWIAAIAAVFFAVPAMAQDREQVLRAMGKCAELTDDKARLACYDALAPRVKEVLATPPAPVASNGPPTKEQQESWFGFNVENLFGSGPATQTTPEKFGSDQMPKPEAPPPTVQAQAPTPGQPAPPPPPPAPPQPEEVDSITAGLTDYAITPFGKFIVFLDNGQVWRQMQGDSGSAHFEKNPKDNKVTIERGFLDSYNLTINGSNKVYKVQRIK